jgi:hypothetical protein
MPPRHKKPDSAETKNEVVLQVLVGKGRACWRDGRAAQAKNSPDAAALSFHFR